MGLFSHKNHSDNTRGGVLNNLIDSWQDVRNNKNQNKFDWKSVNSAYGGTNAYDVAQQGWKSNEGFFSNFGAGLGNMLGGKGSAVGGSFTSNGSGSLSPIMLIGGAFIAYLLLKK